MTTDMEIVPATTATTGDLDRVAFVEWLYAQSPLWTAQADSASLNPIALWFGSQGYCLVQTGFSWALLNYGTVVDEEWFSLGEWGAAFLDACVAMADRVGRNELTHAEVLLAVLDADWATQETMILNRSDLPAA